MDDAEEEEFKISGEDADIIHGIQDGISDPRGASPLPTQPAAKKLTARFGRRRTHNEQILVAPCGMILARETFYGAEAISSCAVCLNLLLSTLTLF